MAASGQAEGAMELTHWTPKKRRRPSRFGRFAVHVSTYRIVWYVGFFATLSLGLQFGIGR